MVKIGLIEVDETQYPDLDLRGYMKCQSQAFTFSTLSFITGGGGGYILTQLLPRVYPKFQKKYNLVVIAGVGVLTSYITAHFMTQQCQRKYFMAGPPRPPGSNQLPVERHYSEKVKDVETIRELPAGVVTSQEQTVMDSEVLFEQHKGVGPKRV